MKLESGLNWVSSKSCEEGDVIEILDEGQWKESTKFTYDDGNPVRQLVFKVKHNGEEKQLSLIKPSKIALKEAFGDDTIEWVGKKAKITLVLNTQGGKSIVLQPITEEVKEEAKEEVPGWTMEGKEEPGHDNKEPDFGG